MCRATIGEVTLITIILCTIKNPNEKLTISQHTLLILSTAGGGSSLFVFFTFLHQVKILDARFCGWFVDSC